MTSANGVTATSVFDQSGRKLRDVVTDPDDAEKSVTDARGNQTQQVQTGTGVTTTTNYGYDLANRLISSSVTNNAVNPLSTGATYAYNAQGQRVTRVEDEVVTHFYYTGSALLFTTVNEYVLQTQNSLDPSGTIVASKRFEGQAATGQDPYAEDYFFYRYDIRGSVTTIVDGEGAVVKSYDYDEFGVTTASGDAFFNEVTFTGSISDASGLLYMNARYYNPATARFLSQDSYTGSAFDPWTQHLYAYCNNNPVNMVDPTGHAAEAIAVGAGLCLTAAIIIAADIIINGTGTQLQESVSKAIDDAADSVKRRIKNDVLITGVILATISLLARATESNVAESIRDTFKEKPQTVYVLLNEAQQIVYVGRTVNPKRREYEHIYKKDARHADTTFHTVASNLTYLEARGLEQQLFVENYSSILRNKIAGISLRNPNYMDYMRAATEINIDRYENWWYIFTGR